MKKITSLKNKKKEQKPEIIEIGQFNNYESGDFYLGRCPTDSRCKCRNKV